MAPGSQGSLGVGKVLLSLAPSKGSFASNYPLFGQSAHTSGHYFSAVAQSKSSYLISLEADNPSQEVEQIRGAFCKFCNRWTNDCTFTSWWLHYAAIYNTYLPAYIPTDDLQEETGDFNRTQHNTEHVFILAAALSPFLPDQQMVDTYRINDSPRIRFSDVPSNSKLVRNQCLSTQHLKSSS
jgi:hypothetical protein